MLPMPLMPPRVGLVSVSARTSPDSRAPRNRATGAAVRNAEHSTAVWRRVLRLADETEPGRSGGLGKWGRQLVSLGDMAHSMRCRSRERWCQDESKGPRRTRRSE